MVSPKNLEYLGSLVLNINFFYVPNLVLVAFSLIKGMRNAVYYHDSVNIAQIGFLLAFVEGFLLV